MKKLLKTYGFVLLFGIFSLMAAKAQVAAPMWTKAYRQTGITIIMTLLVVENEVSITIGDADISYCKI